LQPLDWLASVLPLPLVTLDVQSKCQDCSGLQYWPQVAQARALRCSVSFNSLGREAHSMLSFILTHWAELPSTMLFLQGDALRWQHHPEALQDHSTSLASKTAEELHAWSRRLHSARGFSTAAADCLCRVIIEDYFRQCPTGPVDPSQPRCYGDTYWAIRWVAETLLGYTRMDEMTVLRWPEAAQFAVSKRAVRSRPRTTYLTAMALLNGSAEATATLAYTTPDRGEGDKAYTVAEWAHVFERLWLLVFDGGGQRRSGQKMRAGGRRREI
jgi:hypothetical protein